MARTNFQGELDFSVAYKVQTTWGMQEAITFSLEGIGATLVFAGLATNHSGSVITGLVILMASGLLLLAHLGSPKNVIYLLANVRHSWMSRGAALIPLFMVLGSAILIARSLFHISLDGVFGLGLLGLMLLLTIFILVKSGLVMATFPAIPFWNGGLLPVLFALNGIASGLAIYWILGGDRISKFTWVPPALNLSLLVVTLVYLSTMRTAGSAARVSVQLIWQRHSMLFWIIAVFLGTAVPMALGLYVFVGAGAGSWALFAVFALLRVGGDIALRDVILKVGVYDKVR